MEHRRRQELGRNKTMWEHGGGCYWVVPCETADEQIGCFDWNDRRPVGPPRSWVSIEQLGMNWRIENG